MADEKANEKATELTHTPDPEDRLDLEPQEPPRDENESKISPANIINVVVFVANVTIMYLSEFTTAFRNQRFGDATKRHQTLLSVYHQGRDDSFLIWHGIFAWQLIFVVLQTTPIYRDKSLVRQITPWWILANTTQIAWVLALMLFEDLLVVVAGLAITNFVVILILISRIEIRGLRKPRDGKWLDWQPLFENWAMRVPFSLHAGYMMCMGFMYVNAMLMLNRENLIKDGQPSGVVVATSMTSITAVLTITAVFSMAVPRPDGFFCIGVAWYFYWVYRELNRGAVAFRRQTDASEVSNEIVEAFEFATVSVSFLAGCMAALSFLLRAASTLQRNRVQ